MTDLEGDGADNLDYSSYTYEQLRDAVLGLNGEGIRGAGYRWASLKHQLNERVGTLRVTLTKLDPDWSSPGGRQAIKAWRGQLRWMNEFAKVAAWNEEMVYRAGTAHYKAVKAMRALDAEPDRPNPEPRPNPASNGYVHPADLNPKQPRAAKIANYVYTKIAIATASMALPPRAALRPPIDKGGTDSGRVPGDGPIWPGYRPRDGRGGSRAPGANGQPGRQGSRNRHGSNGSTPGGARGPVTGVGARRSGSRKGTDGQVTGSEPGGRSTEDSATSGNGAAGGRTPTGSGGGTGSSQTPGAARGGSGPAKPGGGGPPGPTDPLGRTLGGPRPPVTPVPSGMGEHIPPVGIPGAASAGGTNNGRGKRKPGYERGEPDTFVDQRTGAPVGGELRAASPERRFDPLPGMVGNQKQTAGQDDLDPWDVPETTTPSPEGFPDKLESFRRSDGTTFEVRRTRGR